MSYEEEKKDKKVTKKVVPRTCYYNLSINKKIRNKC